MTKAMNSRERVRAAIAHAEPDRVPVNYLANPGIDARLKAHFNLAADDREGLLRALGVDFRSVGPPYRGPRIHPDLPGRKVDNFGIRRTWIEHSAGGYWDYCDWPLKDATVEQVAAWPLPSPDDYDYAAIPAQCDRYPDHCLCLGSPGIPDIINGTSMLRTMEQLLIDLADDDPAGLLLIDRLRKHKYEMTRRSLEAARGRIDLLWLGEDLGTQIGPMVSLDLFRRHIRPRHQPFIDLARQAGIPVMLHCCGSSSWAFDDYIQMGVSVMDTLQPEAANMAPAYLKDRFGSRLAFHGCISTAGPLASGTVAQVEDEVRRTLDIMMPGGGYCLAPTHSIQDNTPTANALAMYQTAREHGRYS